MPYSHALHAGEMGIDCRYCHNTVDRTAAAGVPPTDTCMNCHELLRRDREKLIPVFESHATGMPVPWQRIHDLPDFAYFNHSAHVIGGLIPVAVVTAKALRGAYTADEHRGVTYAAMYWHFLDGIWLVMFLSMIAATWL